MKTIGKVLISPVAALAGGLFGKKKSKKDTQPRALPPVTRDSVREEADRRDELKRRRGGAADIVTGAYGAEPAAPTGKEKTGT